MIYFAELMAVTSCMRRALTVVFFLGTIAQPAIVAAQGASAEGRKVDSALRESLATGAPTQHVIITVKSDARASLVRLLKAHGDVIKGDAS